MRNRPRRVLAVVWLIGLLLALGGASLGLSWRLLVVFLVLLALLAWGQRLWPLLRKLEPSVMLILALGIVLATFAQVPEREFPLMQWVRFLLLIAEYR